MECSQTRNDDYMYWYRQVPGLGLQLIYYSLQVNETVKGEISEGYSVSRTKKDKFVLSIQTTILSHSALYFCASSYLHSAV